MKEIDLDQENKIIVKSYRSLLKSIRRVLTKEDKALIREAFELSLEAHKNMRRKSGEPYILHPLAVAQICAEEIGLGVTSVVCALLHDTVEDTDITLDLVKLKFGSKVSRIIDGLTKISGVFDQPDRSIQAENFKKMLLTLSDDVRVILIKLADRLHNMRTLDSMSPKSQLKIASETAYVYAPLAHRLGLYAIKSELEDLSTKYLQAENYAFVKNKLNETKVQRNKYIRNFIEPLNSDMEKAGFKFEIKGRPKSIHSILNKMKKQNVTFEEVYDLFAIRVIVDTDIEHEKSDCWKVYSIVTDHYTPNPDRLRDWVSTPKANGYESLHTTLMGPKGRWVEVQIRTKRMDEIAEKGFAAHWKYKESSANSDNGLEGWLARIRDVLENQDANALEFLDDFKLALYSDEIFVFTPKGDLKKLPAGATVLDFAFDIHTDLGAKCIGAKLNNKLVPLNHQLNNGDQVEILSSAKQKPNEEWLDFVVTAKAKSKIREYFKQLRLKASALGKEILERKFKNAKIPYSSDALHSLMKHFKLKTVTDLYYQLANEIIDRTKIDIESILAAEKNRVPELPSVQPKTKTVILPNDAIILSENEANMDYGFAKCCSPIPGDEIFGFITVGEGVKIHRTSCPNAVALMSNYGYRIIKAKWANASDVSPKAFLSSIKVSGIDSVGIVSIITDIISKQLQINMKSISITSNEGMFEGNIVLQVHDTRQLENIMDSIKSASELITVNRVDLG
ncbi:MAG: bifunctional (p)ppGpp synthetase/guanosine-3',5'-bis(diphosphate) 3'-pyrophosphohydrolase [Bacteroidia bacterium]|nr:bifunctional (p)ppGpp synthetase/guanosine-3',5'-bis(diphosphate) 3'-pyrophosphohydrolase [Bacteroidia bacterium]MCF8425946.1 bifunctional (p)ppGpp synthetase/guanosine-3',5'-bis(diphosphate) 3'-pyrophosphohydrolase [Bacteroidia bacterium]MCF8446291.1 bifunctional (p)ppGpp synthetase/guanosine-3',5'-bis(diphosphate) 3'-pyrophosphohydrolase [Bacteroidia bacterium]